MTTTKEEDSKAAVLVLSSIVGEIRKGARDPCPNAHVYVAVKTRTVGRGEGEEGEDEGEKAESETEKTRREAGELADAAARAAALAASAAVES